MLLRFVLIISCLVLYSGCKAVNQGIGGVLNLETNIQVEFTVASNINPDSQQQPSPLFIRMYALRSPILFEQADFIQLYEHDKKQLGQDYISQAELRRFVPGQNRTEQFTVNDEAKYVGFFAEFNDFENTAYKLVVPVTSNNVIRDRIRIRVSGNRLELR